MRMAVMIVSVITKIMIVKVKDCNNDHKYTKKKVMVCHSRSSSK